MRCRRRGRICRSESQGGGVSLWETGQTSGSTDHGKRLEVTDKNEVGLCDTQGIGSYLVCG